MADVTFTISIDDQGSPVIRNIKREGEDMGQSIEKSAARGASGFTRLQASIVTVGTAVLATRAAISAVTQTITSAISAVHALTAAANEQENAEKARNVALANSGQATRAYINELNAQASAFQRTTTTGDEVIISLQQQLIAFGASREQMQALTQTTLNLAAGMGTDLSSAALLMGKAIAGEFSTLSRYGIFVEDNATKSEKLAQAIDQINQRFGGQAQAAAETYAGRVAQLANDYSDLQEELGFAISSNEAVLAVIAEVRVVLQQMSGDIRDNREAVKEWIDDALIASLSVLRAMAQGVNFVTLGLRGLKEGLTDPNILRGLRTIFSTPEELEAQFGGMAAQAVAAMDRIIAAAERARRGVPDVNQLTFGVTELSTALNQGSGESTVFVAGLEQLTNAAPRAGQALQETGAGADSAATAMAEARAELQAEIAVLQLVAAGTLTAEEAQRKLEVAQLAGKVGSEALAQSYFSLQDAIEANEAALEKEREALDARVDALQKNLAAQLETIRGVEEQIAANQRETQIINAGIAAGETKAQILRDIAVASKAAELATGLLSAKARENAEAFVDSGTALETARENLETYADQANGMTFNVGERIADDMSQMVAGILQGTREGTDILEGFKDLAIAQFADLFAATIRQKLDWEAQLSGNLLNDLPALFGQGAAKSGAAFQAGLGQSLGGRIGVGGLLQSAGIGALAGISTGSPGGGAGAAIGSLGNFAFAGAGEAILSGLLGTGGIATALAGTLGNFLLPGLGFALGFGLEALIGSLFKHVPTKGTQIRRGVIDFLEDIEVSFADELKSGKYFFEFTKDLAEEAFGGDFLAASKQVLQNKAGPELAQQLQALGTALTADQALKLGKPVEQTGTTFGNLLVANLGIDRIPAAIAEIVQKTDLSLASLTAKLTDLFQQGAISADFYQSSILGAVQIFSQDLPAAINISKIALDSFTDDGIFSLTEFARKAELATAQFSGIGEAAAAAFNQGLQDGLTGSQVADAFLTFLEDLVRNVIIAQFVEEVVTPLITDALSQIDLTRPLDLGSPAIQQLAVDLGLSYDNLLLILDAAGLLPDSFNTIADSVDEVTESVQTLGDRFADVFGQVSVDARQVFSALDDVRRINRAPFGSGELVIPIRPEVRAEQFAQNLRADIAESVEQGLTDALIQVAINEAILEPLFAQITALTRAAMADGILTADELAVISETARTGAAVAEEAARALTPAFAEFGKIGDSIRDDFQLGADAINAIDLSPVLAQARDLRRELEGIEVGRSGALSPIATRSPGLAHGGLIPGFGGGDSVRAMLEPGELVVDKNTTRSLINLLQRTGSGGHFQAGGLTLSGPTSFDRFGTNLIGNPEVIELIAAQKREQFVNPPLAQTVQELMDRFLADILSGAAAQGGAFGTRIKLDALISQMETLGDQSDEIARLNRVFSGFEQEQLPVLSSVRGFLGAEETTAERQGRVQLDFERMVAEVNASRAALTAAGFDVDAILQMLADELPNKLSEAVEETTRELSSAVERIRADILRLTTGPESALSPFEQFQVLSERAAGLRADFGAATSPAEQARLGEELSQILQEQLRVSPFDRFGEDFRALFDRNIAEMSNIADQIEAAAAAEIPAGGESLTLPRGERAPLFPTPTPFAPGAIQLSVPVNISVQGSALSSEEIEARLEQLKNELDAFLEDRVPRIITDGRGGAAVLQVTRTT